VQRSSRLHRRERIETNFARWARLPACVPPGFIAGSGLKLGIARSGPLVGAVPPGFIAGSGLKQERGRIFSFLSRSSRLHLRERIETGDAGPMPAAGLRSSRLHRRERIETSLISTPILSPGRSSRLHRRERIETNARTSCGRTRIAPPGFIAGSGLKQQSDPAACLARVPPGFIAGSGLKLPSDRPMADNPGVPPGFIAGSGLKQSAPRHGPRRTSFLPASSPGAD